MDCSAGFRCLTHRVLVYGLAWLWVTTAARAGDWPQILGPLRNGQAVDERGLKPWGDSGPRQLWRAELGEGFAGPAVADSRVVVFHRVGPQERLQAWSSVTGKTLWQRDFPATYRGTVNPDSGPRCVPVLHQGRAYLFGAAGQLHCVSLADGEPIWSRDAYGDFRGSEGYFGAGSTPIVSGTNLLVNVGGRDAGLVAFNLATGATTWKVPAEGASYSSPTSATINGRDAVVFVTRLNTVAVDQQGEVIFRFPFGRRGTTVNAATPLVFADRLFVSASYGVGARVVRLNADPPQVVWENDSAMSSQYTTCVYHDGFLYGVHGREDYGNGELRCVDAGSGKLRWKAPQVGMAHVILVRDQLLVVGVAGRLTLAEAVPDAYRPLADAVLTNRTARALPALAEGRLYLRDTNSLYCFEL